MAVEDLSEEELSGMQTAGAGLYTSRDQRVARAVAEIRRHRATQAASTKRVRGAVKDAFMAGAVYGEGWSTLPDDVETEADVFAAHAAAQLFAPVIALVAEISSHRATMLRLEEWAAHMEASPHHGIGLLDIAAKLRSLMKEA